MEKENGKISIKLELWKIWNKKIIGKLGVWEMLKICYYKISGKLEVWEIWKIGTLKISGKMEVWRNLENRTCENIKKIGNMESL